MKVAAEKLVACVVVQVSYYSSIFISTNVRCRRGILRFYDPMRDLWMLATRRMRWLGGREVRTRHLLL